MELGLAASALLAPWVAATIGAVIPSVPRAARFAAVATGLGMLALIGLAGLVLLGLAPTPALGVDAVALQFDALALILAALVLGLATVIQAFALRYLRADPRQRWFVVTASGLTGSTLLMITAVGVMLFTVAWIAAGVALVLVLNTYPHLEQARAGVRRTARRLALGDAGLVIAVALLITLAGPALGGSALALRDVGAVLADAPTGLAVAIGLLLVVSALARSSQIPFHGWLPATLAAPTPVSALLHAGVVNSGAILILRFSDGIAESALVMAVIFTAGAATLVVATSVRLVKPDVKGRLVFSTMGQMGFMIMACGLGAFAAAIFHMVAHGLYKSTLFLSAGSGVRQRARHRAWPDARPASPSDAAVVAILAATASLAVVAGVRMLIAPDISAATAGLLAYVVLTGAVTTAVTLTTRLSIASATTSLLALVALVVVYTASVTAIDAVLPPIEAGGAVPAWWILAPSLLLVAVQAGTLPGARTALTAGLIDRAYARSLASSIPRLAPVKGI